MGLGTSSPGGNCEDMLTILGRHLLSNLSDELIQIAFQVTGSSDGSGSGGGVVATAALAAFLGALLCTLSGAP